MKAHIARLTVEDLPDCLTLAQDRDWRQEEAKWRLLFQLGEVYGARDEDGALVGTTILTRHNDSLSAISMVLVASRCGGKGLGRQIMTRVLAEVEQGVTVLCSTEMGRPLYDKLGFVATGVLHSYVGKLAVDGRYPRRSRVATPADGPAIVALDAEVHGSHRQALVEALTSFALRIRVLERDRVIVGYGAAWQNNEQLVIGPIIAEDEEAAEVLIREMAEDADGLIRVDIPDRHRDLRDWVQRCGLVEFTANALMVRGGSVLPGDRSRWFSPVMQALG